jgi:hypothetical protein
MGVMSPSSSARPSQVTVAGWGIAGASVFLLFVAFDAMAKLHSVDTREEVTRVLSTGSGKNLGISVPDALEVMRWALLVTGVAAAAAGVLGVFVLQRNKGARIGLTVAAVPIVLAAPFSGGQDASSTTFLSVFIAAATGVLWSRPSRDWFAGRSPEQRPPVTRAAAPTPPPAPTEPVTWVPPTLPADPGVPGPAPTPGWGQVPPPAPPGQPGQPWPAPPPPPHQWPAHPWPPPAPYSQASRPDLPVPRQVRIACVLTWVFTAITGLAYLLLLVVLAVDSGGLMDKVRESSGWDSSYDEHTVVVAAIVVSVLFLLWCAGAAVLAYFAWRRAVWAWVMLSVSTGLAALVSIVAVPYSIVHLIALGVAVGMLLSRPAREWYAGR